MSKLVLITGAGKGIGYSLAKQLANEGYDLVLLCNSETSKAKLLKTDFVCNRNHKVEILNIADEKAVCSFAAAWDRQLWGIVNNAGICKTMGIEVLNQDDPFDQVMKTNLYGPYQLTKGLLPFVSTPGRIINISSQLGMEGRAGYSAYCASKFGLIGLTKCWAKELGSRSITVNAICPGWVDTEMSRVDMTRLAKERYKSTKEYYQEICNPLELKRFNSTEEVSNLAVFLLSDNGSGVTGRDWLMQTIWNQS